MLKFDSLSIAFRGSRRHELETALDVALSAKLIDLDLEAYLAAVVDRMAKGNSINRLDELLPWNWRRGPVKLAA